MADVDLAMLARARGKLPRGQKGISLLVARADDLPFVDCTIDRAVSCLVLHHLRPAVKRAALAELLRTLRPGRQFHLLDFGPSSGALSWLLSLPWRLFDG